MEPVLRISGLQKSFTLHQQGGIRIPVFDGLEVEVSAGEAVAITGPSGRGKSSLLKLIYGTYHASAGSVRIRDGEIWRDIVTAEPHEILDLRRTAVGYVTQFLRVIPRVPSDMIVAEPLLERGTSLELALERAHHLLERLAIPERLWRLSPLTFSGGEQQRVNIARGFAARFPLLLLDEPTASLDAQNRGRVLELVDEARAAGSAVVAIFHDAEERRQICSREITLA